jgi:hypothetical protein
VLPSELTSGTLSLRSPGSVPTVTGSAAAQGWSCESFTVATVEGNFGRCQRNRAAGSSPRCHVIDSHLPSRATLCRIFSRASVTGAALVDSGSGFAQPRHVRVAHQHVE